MGEYATYRGKEIKIGTCENMYYLRADQRHAVGTLPGNVDVGAETDLNAIRFRFPWPDEDTVAPGEFDRHDRALGVDLAFSTPLDVEHGNIQFTSHVGLVCSLPCLLGPDAPKTTAIHKNGWGGDVQLVQTAFRGGEWCVVCRCGGCWYPYRLPRWAAEELAAAIRADGEKRPDSRTWYNTVADRVLEGYLPDAGKEAV